MGTNFPSEKLQGKDMFTRPRRTILSCHVSEVTTDWVSIDNLIYWPLTDRDYK
jgi:hypothetical protein